MKLADRVRSALAASAHLPVPYLGDMRLRTDGTGTAAAVLIAITDRPEPGVILTQRPQTMRRHAGQVAFPGGRVDRQDADIVAAALREAHEEIALSPDAVEVIDTLAPYRTVTGFEVVPVIGIIAPDVPFIPQDTEVDAVFEVPLAHVLAPTAWTEQRVMVSGVERRYLEMMWEDRRIWGATAAMLANLSARLQW